MEKKREKRGKINKKAQLTIFIILAIVIVAILLILLYPRMKVLVTGPVAPDYIKDCTEDATKEVLDKLTVQGGSLEPENYILYQGNKVDYVCYAEEYYKKCVMQKPFLKQDIEKEITSYIEPRVKTCLEDLKSQLEKRGSAVSLGKVEVETLMIPNSILVTINAPLTITKEATSSFKKFKVDVSSHLYDLIMISSSISNWEARYGDSETMNYMIYYPNIKVEKKKQSEGSTIYILTDRETDEKFMFASRSVALPAGLTGQ